MAAGASRTKMRQRRRAEDGWKTCSRCEVRQPVSAFASDRKRPDGLQYICRTCTAELARQWVTTDAGRQSARAAQRRYYAANRERRNAEAKQWQDANRERMRQAQRAWIANNPERYAPIRARSRLVTGLKRYGLTAAEYEELMVAQGGVCAICRRPPGRYRLAVDHDHQTGQVRGLLCRQCNAGIGFLGDRAEQVEAAVAYLRQAAMALAGPQADDHARGRPPSTEADLSR